MVFPGENLLVFRASSLLISADFGTQGVTVLPEVAMSAKIMIATLVAYFIISGPSWAKSPGSTHTASLVTSIVCFVMLAAYCAQQVASSMGESTVNIKNEKKLELHAQEVQFKKLKAQAAVIAAVQFLSKKKVAPSDAMKAPLIEKSAEEQAASSKLAVNKAALKWKSKVLSPAIRLACRRGCFCFVV
jgi:hypothetical protein